MNHNLVSNLARLESLRGDPVVMYASAITEESVRILYECLRKLGRVERLNLVLSTRGGSVVVARQAALLLREHVGHLTILVPYRARSAGTLLCLSADDIVLGPMAELSPIDSHVSSTEHVPSDAPGMISAEDVRQFTHLAKDWFGVDREEDRLQVLALVAQRIFPTSLSSFYRFDKLVRDAAGELLRYQLPDAPSETRQRIVDQLVAGYHAHEYTLSRTEAHDLGLAVRFTTAEEETLLWEISEEIRLAKPVRTETRGRRVTGLIVGPDFFASEMLHPADDSCGDLDDPQSGAGIEPEWSIET